MAITFDTKYPATLKNAAWQKKKSFKDKTKSKTKTGLGQTLLQAEAAWKAIKFNELIAAKQGATENSNKSLEELKQVRSKANDYLNNDAQPVQKAIEALDKAASRARVTAKNGYLSDTAKKAATALSGQLTAQAKLLRNIKLTDFANPIQRLNVSLTKVEGQHTEMLHAMDDVVDKLKSAGDTEEWEELKTQQYVQEGMRISQLLAERDGDKAWTDTNNRWRRIMMAYAETDRKVKSQSPGYGLEAMKEFANLAQHELGGLFY